jgi:hypothetical protein
MKKYLTFEETIAAIDSKRKHRMSKKENDKESNGELWIVLLSAIILIFIIAIFAILANCVVVSCDNIYKYKLEKEEQDFIRETVEIERNEKFLNSRYRKQILEDCEKLKMLIEKEKNPYIKADYEFRYREDCIGVLVVK